MKEYGVYDSSVIYSIPYCQLPGSEMGSCELHEDSQYPSVVCCTLCEFV